MLLRTGLSIHVRFANSAPKAHSFLVPGVSVALLNTAVDSDNGNSVMRRHVTRALQIWPTSLESTVQEGITRGEFRADVDPTECRPTLIMATLEVDLMISRLQSSQNALYRAQQRLNEYL